MVSRGILMQTMVTVHSFSKTEALLIQASIQHSLTVHLPVELVQEIIYQMML
jgi:hypothetical protein